MSATEKRGLLMDAPAIARELGVTEHVAIQIARWAGHSRASESQDTYGHVVLDPRGDRWRRFWIDLYNGRRETPVRHEDA